jgi:hypothetical protein
VENACSEYLDDLILSQARHWRLKVAPIFVCVRQKCEVEGRIVSDEKLNERLRYLVDSGELEAFGEISNWRFSEVRLKTQTENGIPPRFYPG